MVLWLLIVTGSCKPNFNCWFLVRFFYDQFSKEGWVILEKINEGDNVFLLLKEVVEVNGGGSKRGRVEG